MEKQLKEYSERLEKKVEERTRQLKNVQEQLLETAKLATIGEVAAMAGHDLRNPLQAMVSFLYLARKRLNLISCPSPEKKALEEICGDIGEQMGYMNKIVSDLQDYSRPLNPELSQILLHQLVGEILSTTTIPETIQVSNLVPEDLKLTVDSEMMKRVLINLVTNALQAMPEGGELKIKASKTEEEVLIGIEDTGVGIPKENLDKIFRPLFTTKPKGQGLGLSVCKRMAKAHGGNITVESQVGKGSTFTVVLPFGREVK
jgi:signal transduction histidine kinase